MKAHIPDKVNELISLGLEVKQPEGYERYWVCEDGQIIGCRGDVLKQVASQKGYIKVILVGDDGKRWTTWVHNVVMLAFAGPKPEGMETRHLDGNKLNNAKSNLVYGTRSENQKDRVAHGTHHETNKTHCPQGHEYTQENTHIGNRGKRWCRLCYKVKNDKRLVKTDRTLKQMYGETKEEWHNRLQQQLQQLKETVS